MASIKTVKPNCIKIDSKVVIYDVFYSNIKKCVAILFNPCHLCEEEVDKIKVFINQDGCLTEIPIIGSEIHHSRPCDYNIKSWTHTEINGLLYFEYKSENMIVEYEKESIKVKINNKEDDDESCEILLSTMTHEPCYHGIKSWINYHKKFDITNYSLYINDYSDTNINSILDITKDIQSVNINIIEWNFSCYSKLNGHTFHGAQIQSMNHAMHYFNHKSVILTDVDEYLFSKSIKDIMEKYKDFACLFINNKWAKRESKNIEFGTGEAMIYDSERDNIIIKNMIIDRKQIKTALIHGLSAKE